MDPLHSPILEQKISKNIKAQEVPGHLSLEVFIPHVGNLEWEEIAEIRAEASLIEFRNKLIETEKAAREMIGSATSDEIKDVVSRILVEELLDEIKNLSPSLSKSAIDVGFEIIGNLLSPIGVAKSIFGITNDIQDLINQKKSWITTFMKVRQK